MKNKNRSGGFRATNDYLIEEMINDPLYDIREDGTIWTLITRTGKKSVKGIWREAGCAVDRGENGFYCDVKYKRKTLRVHRIIYRKFIGPLSEDLVINHIDGNGTNNLPSNLELITQRENVLHSYRVLGNPPVISNAVISLDIARQIRADKIVHGLSHKELMKKYPQVKSKGHISEIINNNIWIETDEKLLEDVILAMIKELELKKAG